MNAVPLPLASRNGKVRVVVLLHTIAYGGVETLVINWLRTLDPRRVEATAVCFANPGGTEAPFERAAQDAGLPLRKIDWNRRKPVYRAARQLAAILREVAADVLHTHNTYSELVGWLAARMTGVKLMTTLYVWSDFGWRRNVQQWISARLLCRFDLVTCQCATTMTETIRRGVPRHLQRVLISGIPVVEAAAAAPTRTRVREQQSCDDDHVVLLNVARLYPEKGQEQLLRWFARIFALRPQARLWIVGVGPLEAGLKALVDELGLARCVSFLGFRSDLLPVFRAADLQVHSSHAEGIPLAICEGMAAGMPLVSTLVGGIGEIVRDGRSGLLVADGDEEGFVGCVLRMIDDRPAREAMGRSALELSRTEYSPERAADMLASCYEELAR